MTDILFPTHRTREGDPLWICDACGAAEWASRKPAHECPAKRDAWGKRTLTPMRPATPKETAAGVQALVLAA